MQVYLDNNATTKIDDRVLEKMLPYLKEEYANPSSMYNMAQNPHKAIESARLDLMNFIGASNPKEIVFTSCATESANMAIRGVINSDKTKKHLITTKVEHPCVLNLHKELENEGYRVTYIGVDSNGDLDLDELRNSIRQDTALVSVMMANNEVGTIFPIDKVVEIVKEKNKETKIFTDAVQAAGKTDINVSKLGVDFLSISAHKFHGPKGVGALYIKTNNRIKPLIIGGHQERGQRAGTENVAYIVGMAEASKIAKENLNFENTSIKALRDKLEKGILDKVFNATLNSKSKSRTPNTTNIGFQYIEGELILLHLSEIGIYASSGSACTSGSLEPSHVLRAMGVPFTSLHGSIRFSLSKYTTEEEIDYVLEKLPDVIENLTKISPFQKELTELKQKRNM